jgi:predicted DNA-binding protein
MSNPDNGSNKNVKTLAIRLEPDLHAQLSLIAQLRGSTITDEIRQAIETHIATMKAAPELAAQADSVLEDIEREAVARRAAIATLFGNEHSEQPDPATEAPTPISRARSGRKPAASKEDSPED